MQDIGTFIIQILIAIVIHEFGHIIHYRLIGHKPKIEIKWWGLILATSDKMGSMSGIQIGINALMGISAGFLYLAFAGATPFTMMSYFVMCCIDLGIIMQMLNHPLNIRRKTVADIVLHNHYDLRKKM